MMRRSSTAALLLLPIVLLAAREGHAVATRTYDVVVRAYCSTANPCGFATVEQMEDSFREQLAMVNRAWEPLLVSFRLRELIVDNDPDIAGLVYSADVDDVNTTAGAIIRDLRDLAMTEPDVVTLFALPALDTCWSAVPPAPLLYPSANYGVFCSTTADWTVLAHEFGHHFCLPHPFTFQDRDELSFVGHDGDGIVDTPPDPGLFEDDPAYAGADVDGAGVTREFHEWCEFTQNPADMGSPVALYCTSSCKYQFEGQTEITGEVPNTALNMSYYKHACSGPYVVGNKLVPAFSQGQVQVVNQCIATVSERQDYVDICADGFDADNDGICDVSDSCPDVSNTFEDFDNDGVDNACDLCLFVPDPTNVDTDGDKYGDACDTDIDNDGCANALDDDPQNPTRPNGSYLTPNCSSATAVRYGFAGADTDGDGLLDCDLNETDDDDDGVLDDDDPCPTTVGVDPASCQELSVGCPLLTELSTQCLVNCGETINLVVLSVINPENSVTFENFSVVDRTLFVGRQGNLSNSEVAGVLDGTFFEDLRGFDGRLQFDFISTSTGARVDTLGVVDTSGFVTATSVQEGFVVAMTSTGADGGFSLDGTFGLSVARADFHQDGDRDGVPDSADNCVEIANASQLDRDRDRFGDACDPDFDNDLIVSDEEVQRVIDCVGANLTPAELYGEPGLETLLADVASVDERVRARTCAEADLTGDGVVDEVDAALAATLQGAPPGPAGSMELPEPPPGDPSARDGCSCSTGTTSAPLLFVLLALFVAVRSRRASREQARSRRAP